MNYAHNRNNRNIRLTKIQMTWTHPNAIIQWTMWIFEEEKNAERYVFGKTNCTRRRTLTPLASSFPFVLIFSSCSGTKVLNGVTGILRSGRATAIMGPSGCGKTTFLTTLAGRATYGKTIGKVEINGALDSLLKYPKLVGFVPQDDVMHRDCTVEENLLFSARTRLPSTLSCAEQRQFVEDTLELLGLSDLRHSVIGDEVSFSASLFLILSLCLLAL